MSPAAAAASFPVIDFSPFFTTGGGENEVEKEEVINSIREACSDYGFFVAVNHGIPAEAMDRSLEMAHEFFDRPSEEKLKCTPPTSDTPVTTGYAKQPDHSPNKNEYFLMFEPASAFNVYPTSPAPFRGAVDEIYGGLLAMARLIESLMNRCLGVPEGLMEKFNDDRQWDIMTAFRYFAAAELETPDKKTGLYGHKDVNLMTLVLQDQVGGLEFQKDGEWIPITPIPHSLVVNVGDIIQVLSNNKFKSVNHKVNSPQGRDRHSFAFAYLIGFEKMVEPLAEVMKESKEEPKFSKFRYKDYFQLRVADLFNPPANLDDAVTINHYAIPPTVAAAAAPAN
ncbi:unnamed protein product [Linum tenue]|uniref:Fe2OG dioxygenase domain-containing protein n=1 Tax=Linum tenue TaxID=586396 RepID=A0AAV0IP63_9ROSI|nr:unnamed protein product [Linum tenue]